MAPRKTTPARPKAQPSTKPEPTAEVLEANTLPNPEKDCNCFEPVLSSVDLGNIIGIFDFACSRGIIKGSDASNFGAIYDKVKKAFDAQRAWEGSK